MSCQSRAEAFVQKYAAAMHLAQSSSSTPSSIAIALAACYLPTMTAFSLGHVPPMPNQEIAFASVKQHLDNFERTGLGYDIRLKKSRVETVSPASALCWVTWEIHPKNGVEKWEWENVYGYRMRDKGEGWEFVISDNEMANLVQRVPGFFQTMG